MVDLDNALQLAPKDYLEIFGESQTGPLASSLGKRMERDDHSQNQSDDSIFNSKLPMHLIQPRSTHDESPLSRVASDYKIAARKAIAHGVPVQEILGFLDVDVSTFLKDDESQNPEQDIPRVDKWASLVNKSFEDVDVFVRLGSAYLHCCLMRVSLSRISPANYQKIHRERGA